MREESGSSNVNLSDRLNNMLPVFDSAALEMRFPVIVVLLQHQDVHENQRKKLC